MKITHILKDGTTLDTMKGFEIPYNDQTKAIYVMIANATRDVERKRMEGGSDGEPRR